MNKIIISPLNKDEAIELFKTGNIRFLHNYYRHKSPISLLFKKKATLEYDIEISKLYGCIKPKLKDVFGKQLFCYTTWYRSWNWFVEYKDLTINISSSIRGTTYIVHNLKSLSEKEIKVIAEEFTNELIYLLNIY